MSGTTCAMLGYGRFGEAFTHLLQQAGYSVCAYDPQAAIPAEIRAPSLPAALERADWVVLAMPIRALRAALEIALPYLHGAQTVLDVGSVKLHPCATMDELLGKRIPHLGSHPLFGPLSLSRGDRPLRVVICPSADHPQAAVRASDLYHNLGCETVELDPARHDRAMARTHAMAYFLAKGLMEFGVDDCLALAPPSFQGMRRMLDAVRGDAGHLFAAIQRENPYAAEAREQLLAALEQVNAELLTQADDDSLAIPAPRA